jgi:hypothetical protein
MLARAAVVVTGSMQLVRLVSTALNETRMLVLGAQILAGDVYVVLTEITASVRIGGLVASVALVLLVSIQPGSIAMARASGKEAAMTMPR